MDTDDSDRAATEPSNQAGTFRIVRREASPKAGVQKCAVATPCTTDTQIGIPDDGGAVASGKEPNQSRMAVVHNSDTKNMDNNSNSTKKRSNRVPNLGIIELVGDSEREDDDPDDGGAGHKPVEVEKPPPPSLYLRPTTLAHSSLSLEDNQSLQRKLKAEEARAVLIRIPRRTIGNPSDRVAPVTASCLATPQASGLRIRCSDDQASASSSPILLNKNDNENENERPNLKSATLHRGDRNNTNNDRDEGKTKIRHSSTSTKSSVDSQPENHQHLQNLQLQQKQSPTSTTTRLPSEGHPNLPFGFPPVYSTTELVQGSGKRDSQYPLEPLARQQSSLQPGQPTHQPYLLPASSSQQSTPSTHTYSPYPYPPSSYYANYYPYHYGPAPYGPYPASNEHQQQHQGESFATKEASRGQQQEKPGPSIPGSSNSQQRTDAHQEASLGTILSKNAGAVAPTHPALTQRQSPPMPGSAAGSKQPSPEGSGASIAQTALPSMTGLLSHEHHAKQPQPQNRNHLFSDDAPQDKEKQQPEVNPKVIAHTQKQHATLQKEEIRGSSLPPAEVGPGHANRPLRPQNHHPPPSPENARSSFTAAVPSLGQSPTATSVSTLSGPALVTLQRLSPPPLPVAQEKESSQLSMDMTSAAETSSLPAITTFSLQQHPHSTTFPTAPATLNESQLLPAVPPFLAGTAAAPISLEEVSHPNKATAPIIVRRPVKTQHHQMPLIACPPTHVGGPVPIQPFPVLPQPCHSLPLYARPAASTNNTHHRSSYSRGNDAKLQVTARSCNCLKSKCLKVRCRYAEIHRRGDGKRDYSCYPSHSLPLPQLYCDCFNAGVKVSCS